MLAKVFGWFVVLIGGLAIAVGAAEGDVGCLISGVSCGFVGSLRLLQEYGAL